MNQSAVTESRESEGSRVVSSERQLHPARDFVQYVKEYTREKPEMVALWCFGIGFIVGWKLKPW